RGPTPNSRDPFGDARIRDSQTLIGRWSLDRRELLKGAVGVRVTLWAAPILRASPQSGQNALREVTDKIALIDVEGSNVVALSADGVVLVDTGSPKTADALAAALNGFAPN